jgi:sporulation protein YlmC with PRC-barrel domain
MPSDSETLAGSLLSGQKLLGRKVENPRGEGLGKLEDLMISADSGRIAYAVVSFGGVLRLGNKLFAFPWSALRVDQPRKKIILDLDKKTLAKAHGFDKDHWPDASTWNWGPAVPVPAPSAPAAPERAAEPVSVESPTSAGNRMEHWGKNWESHGLDRS